MTPITANTISKYCCPVKLLRAKIVLLSWHSKLGNDKRLSEKHLSDSTRPLQTTVRLFRDKILINLQNRQFKTHVDCLVATHLDKSNFKVQNLHFELHFGRDCSAELLARTTKSNTKRNRHTHRQIGKNSQEHYNQSYRKRHYRTQKRQTKRLLGDKKNNLSQQTIGRVALYVQILDFKVFTSAKVSNNLKIR